MITVYKCPVCGVAYYDKGVAEKCCVPKFCEDCGVEIKKYLIRCKACGLKRKFERAEKLTPERYSGWVYSEEVDGYNEGYYADVDELVEYCEDNDVPVPDWVFCCTPYEFKLDIDSALERMTEDAYEGADDHLVDVKELREFVEKWNAKQSIISYYPDYKRVVVLKSGDSDA